MGSIKQKKVINMNNVFDDRFLDIKNIYLSFFSMNCPACSSGNS